MVTQKGLLQIAATGSFLYPFFERPASGKTNLFGTSAKPKTAAALQRHGNKSGIFLQFWSYLTEEPLEGQYVPANPPFKTKVPKDFQAVL